MTWGGLGLLSGGTPSWRDVGADDTGDNGLSAPDNVRESLQNAWSSEVATPGDINVNQTTGDINLPVELTSFTAYGSNGKVSIKWATESEIDNRGFYLYRSEKREGDYNQLSDLIKGAGNSSSRIVYNYIDRGVFNGITYWYKLVDIDFNGARTEHPVISALPHLASAEIGVIDDATHPQKFVLKANYPNPFNPETTIGFDISGNSKELVNVNLSVYDILGQKVVTLIDEALAPNSYTVKWNGKNGFGINVPSAVYFYLLKSEQYISSRKMIFAK